MTARVALGCPAFVLGAALFARGLEGQGLVLTAGRAREIANQVLLQRGGASFVEGRGTLQDALGRCTDRECRTVLGSALGDLHQREAGTDRANSENLYQAAVQYYRDVLRETPDDPGTLYKTALVYRAMGPHEWQESFFRDAAQQDPSHGAVYLSFGGDYYSARGLWDQAVITYQRALQVDPDNDGARSGLVEALQTQGPRGVPELVRLASEWELRSPEFAADGYQAALAGALLPPSDTLAAARALIGLVSVRARGGRPLASDLPSDWAPVQQLRAFLEIPEAPVPWWTPRTERREALALSALARGRELVARGRPEDAERYWRAGADVAPEVSGTFLDLNRELALLYFGHPALDPKNQKFGDIEARIFEGKGEALALGNLEAAQRFHTALGLIYAQRHAWHGPYARNAVDQLTWALEKADLRRRQEGLYQPLPEIKMLLARGIRESLSLRARDLFLAAAASYYDADDVDSAVGGLREAGRLGAPWRQPQQASRDWYYRVAPPGADDCAPTGTSNWPRTVGTPPARLGGEDFLQRQRFKMLADCSGAAPAPLRRALAAEAFALVDSGAVTLVGAGDVSRFERVTSAVLSSVGLTVGAAHLDLQPGRMRSGITVSLPGETKAYSLTVPADAMVAARILGVLGPDVGVSRLRVSGGVVELCVQGELPGSVVARLRGRRGVREVRISCPSAPGGAVRDFRTEAR